MKKIISKLSTACPSGKTSWANPERILRVNYQILIVFLVLFSLFTIDAHAQSAIGTITKPPSIPDTGGNVQGYVANLIKAGITLLLSISFIAAFVWLILAGFKFITSGGDPKAIEAAKSQITWGIIGLVVILTSYAILRVVEIFFRTSIISGAFIIG